MKVIFTIILSAFFGLQLAAQCTVFAGSPQSLVFNLCEGQAFDFSTLGDEVLELAAPTDTLVFVVHDGGPTTLGNIIAVNSSVGNSPPATGLFVWSPAYQPGVTYQITAFAGNALPAGVGQIGIDLADPCLSVSAVGTVTYSAFPVISAGPDLTLNCNTPILTLAGSGPTGPGYQYIWTTTGGNIISGSGTLNPIVNTPGIYYFAVWSGLPCGLVSDTMVVLPDVNQPVVVVNPGGNITIPCDGSPLFLDGTGSSTGPQYSYEWVQFGGGVIGTNITATVPNPVAGFYSFTVTDNANGCVNSQFFGVYPKVQMDVNSPQVVCDAGTYNIDVGFANDDPPYTLFVSANGGPPMDYTSEIDPNIGHANFPVQITESTDFQVILTDASGCTATFETTMFIFESNNQITVTNDGCNPVAIDLVVNTIPPPFTYSINWSNGDFGPQTLVTTPGWYYATVTDDFGCNNVDSVFVTVDYAGVCATIQGVVQQDNLDNCVPNTGEQPLANWLVQAIGLDTFYATTDATGFYAMPVNPGSYTVSVVPPSTFWAPCSNGFTANVPNPDDVAVVDFLVKKLPGCPELLVDITTPFLRRCNDSYYFVNYCNQGVETATDAYVVVDFDDFITFITASVPSTDLGNNQYQFNIGDLEPGDCGSFWVNVAVSCDAVLGQTHCTEAHIYPDSTCLPPNPLWSGASLKLEASCTDSLRFTVTNIGTNAMSAPLDFVVIEDAVMYMQSPPSPTLGVSEVFELVVPANGSTWRMEVQQEPFHPVDAAFVAAVEGCGANFSTGFINQFPLGDDPIFLDIDCTENIASYDPNDKQGFPVGYGPQHTIEPGTELQYLVRFQNTGTDTAFNVVIRDTLSTWLDVTSIRPGAASHPYQFEIYSEGVVRFTFPNILLPDSSANQAGSNGFVHFTAKPRADVPHKTVIENTAAIYFDFNEPVLTNTVFHTIDSIFLTISDLNYLVGDIDLKVSPNPFDVSLKVQLSGVPSGKSLTFSLLDATGRQVKQEQFTAPSFVFAAQNMAAGLYFFKIEDEGKVIATGKVVRR